MDHLALSQQTFKFPNEVCRLQSVSSVRIGSKIFVDGGDASIRRCASTPGGACSDWNEPNNYLWALSLDREFSVQQLPIQSFLKPQDVSVTVGGALWTNKPGTTLYAFGGAYDLINTTTPNYQIPSWPTIWGYNISTGVWFNVSTIGDRFQPAAYSSYCSVPDLDLSFVIGGVVSNETTVLSSIPGYGGFGGVPDPGLMMFNSGSLAPYLVNNSTVSGLPYVGSIVRGSFVYLPFGRNGMLMMLGGSWSSSDGLWIYPTLFDVVYLFDIASGTWYSQKTSFDQHLPNPRHFACAAAAFGNNSATVDIFLMGGDPDCSESGTGCDSPGTFSRGIDILTLPAFRWFHFPDVKVSPNSSMSGDACHIIGSNLIRIGGWNSWLDGRPDQSCEPIVSVLDLNNLTWTQNFDPLAPDYESPSAIREWNANHTSPVQGWSLGLDAIFSAKPSPNPTPIRHRNLKSIIGGTIGGLAAVVLLVVAFLLYRRRTKVLCDNSLQKDSTRRSGGKLGAMDVSGYSEQQQMHSIPGGDLPELPENQQVFEVPGFQPVNVDVMDARSAR